jgi:hypothetical protein
VNSVPCSLRSAQETHDSRKPMAVAEFEFLALNRQAHDDGHPTTVGTGHEVCSDHVLGFAR